MHLICSDDREEDCNEHLGEEPVKRLIKCIVITCAVLFCFVAVVAITMIIPYDITEKIFADIGEMAFLAEFSVGDIEDEDIHDLGYAEAFQKSIEYEGHCYSVFGYAFNDFSTARAYYTRASGERPFPELWFSWSLHSDTWKTDYPHGRTDGGAGDGAGGKII